MRLPVLVLGCLLTLAAPPVLAAQRAGQTLPAANAPNQGVVSGSVAPFTWQPVTLPYGVTGSPSDQTATFGGPLVVAPTGASENGVTVTMPGPGNTSVSGLRINIPGNLGSSTANGILITNGGNILFSETGYGNVSFPGSLSFGGALSGVSNITFKDPYHSINLTNGGPLTLSGSSDGILINGPLVSSSTSTVPLMVKAASGQTADLDQYLTSTGTIGAKVAANFTATFPALLTAIKTVSANYTLTPTDTTILVNGAYSVTLPAPTASLAGHVWTVKQIGAFSSPVVGTIDGNAGGYTLAGQYNFINVSTDGVSFWLTGKG